MNYLKHKTSYLCGPMLALADDGKNWREYVTTELKKFGVNVLDPTRKKVSAASEIDDNKKLFKQLVLEERFTELTEIFAPVARWDLRSVDKADFLIVNYDPTVPSVGTIHEMVTAQTQKKPILVKYDKNQLDKFNPWMTVIVEEKHLFPTWKSLFDHLEIVNGGTFDKKLWTL